MTIDEIRKAQEDGFRFTVVGSGVAYFFRGPQTEWVEVELEREDDDEYECEMEEHGTGMIYMVMVGDDHKHVVDPADVEIAPDYCRVCGQIGCTHDGVDRDA